ncbi:tensin-1-like [Engraulis encrasicolus]|uniref:tensin-1-like n=1 Tax=Engraulis encrasicolus TaxID=184585 RepID=UPI002FCF5EB6
MARLNWCLAAVISWGKFIFSCFFPSLRAARREQPDELESVHTHSFKVKSFKKAKCCDACKQAVTKEGLVCKNCKLGIHKKCEVKVTVPCKSAVPPKKDQGSTKSILDSPKQRPSR